MGQCPFLGPCVSPMKWGGHILKMTFVNCLATWLPSSILLGMELCPFGGSLRTLSMGPLPFPVQGVQPWYSFPVLCIAEESCKTGAALPEEAIGMALHPSHSFCRHPEIQPVSSVDWSCFYCWQPEILSCVWAGVFSPRESLG